VELAQSAGDSIRVIREHTQQVATAAGQIAAGARQQLAGMDQITRAVETINQGGNPHAERHGTGGSGGAKPGRFGDAIDRY